MKIIIFLLLTVFISVHAEESPSPQYVRKLIKPYMNLLEVDRKALDEAKDKIELGKKLFYDKRLSGEKNISCNSCHDLQKYGTGGEHYLKLKEDGKVFRDVPSIYNLKNFEIFGWSGETKKLNEKIGKSFLNPHEMSLKKEADLIERINSIEGYRTLFKNTFPGTENPVSKDNAIIALEEFIKGLVTPAPIDKFLKGDDKALTEMQLAGALKFDNENCFSCHTGSSFGGQMIIKVGILEPWPNQKDQGYYEISKDPAHKMAFRVSPLRNVEKTAPYFHDASSKIIWDAVRKMARYELGKHMSLKEIHQIQEFLKSMTGEIPEEYIKEPELPE